MAGQWSFPDKSMLNSLEGATALLKTGSANYRLALVTSSWTPNNSTNEVWGDASANEISAAGQTAYAAGGVALASVVLNQTTGTGKFAAADQVWTADGTGIPAWRRAVIYYLGTLNGKVNPIVCHCLGDATPADIPLTTSGNTLSISLSGAGIFNSTHS